MSQSNNAEQLEQAILDLGAEVFQLRHELAKMSLQHSSMLKLFDALKVLLNEKGLLSLEEFEDTIDMGFIKDLLGTSESESSECSLWDIKKECH